ncbi:MAG: efflux RND transporter periplasmic adaptor subunit, partial [Halobacteria archaeon]|nr:efflux RND transporter periplasmic adaptor subunit [Halobacteria archaeon]
EVDFTNAEDSQNMLPGYSADIEVILAEQKHTLRIPTEAILEGNKVLVLGADGLLAERQIKSGLSNWEFTEVLTGLKQNENVVVTVDRDGVEDGASAESEPSQ